MSAGASRDVAVPADRADRDWGGTGRGVRLVWVEAMLAVVAFAALCLVVFSVPGPRIAVEPDDGAYHHSIVAITMGYFLTLSDAQLTALDARMAPSGTRLPNQWIQRSEERRVGKEGRPR